MKVDFHVHTSRSVDAVASPRQVVKYAKKLGLDAIAITDHNRLFPHALARQLSREFGLLVIPGMEGGNIAIRKHWIALGISRPFESLSIDTVLSFIRNEGGCLRCSSPPCKARLCRLCRSRVRCGRVLKRQ